MNRAPLVGILLGFLCTTVWTAPEKKDVSFSGFLDTYYGFDFNQPSGDRAFTTQAVRHNEFSINLAYVDVKLDKEKIHGRLALQAGTSVYSNYSGELRYGPTAGPQLADILRHIQEAYGGYRLAEGLWIDAGIYFAPYGPEGFISKENWTYTRSLAAEFSPYYQAGVRLSYQWNTRWLASLNVINGWQNLIDINSDKALGMQVTYTPTDSLSISYNNFIGRVQAFRVFNDLVIKLTLRGPWSVAASSDVGFQEKADHSGYSSWYVETLLTQFRVSGTVAFGGRVEYFADPDQVVVATKTTNGFRTFGASLNIDWQPDPSFIFRNEIRSLFSQDAIFPGVSGATSSSTLFVTSLAMTF